MSGNGSETVLLTVAGEGLRLAARKHPPSPHEPARATHAVVAPPHPLYGGSMANPVVVALVAGLTAAGSTCVAFNWRGVGGSDGVPSAEGRDADADYRAGLDHLPSDAPLVAAGYSFGAAAALRAASADPRIVRVVVIAPPAAMLEGVRPERLPTVRVIVGDADGFAPQAALQAFAGRLADGAVRVVAGADHFFGTISRARLVAEVVAACR